MKSRFFLYIVVAQSSPILKLLSSKDEALLIRGNTFFILNLSLHILNGIWGLDVQGDGLASKGLNEDLHGTTTESEDEMKGWLFLDVVVAEGSAVFELLSSENEALLIGRDALLVLDLGLDVLDSVDWFDIKSDSLSCKCLYEYLHLLFALLEAFGVVLFIIFEQILIWLL